MELFDMVKAAPPPLRVRESPKNSRGASQLPDTPSPTPSTKAATTSTEAAASASSSPHLEIIKDDPVEPCKRLKVRLKRTVSRELVEGKEPNGKDNDDDDNDVAVDDSLLHSFPPKTKAQQKSFADLPRIASSGQQLIKPVCVRVKRLTTAEIEKFTTPKGKSPATPMSGPRKRGRPKKLPNTSDSTDSSPSPPKMPKVHIKVPLVPSDTKSRAHHHSPTKTKGRLGKSKKATTTTQRSQELINRYGSRFFNCYVKIKRTQMSRKQMQSQPKASGSGGPAVSRDKKTLKNPNKRRPRKSNPTVSFSESVEIFGSSRRSALGMRLMRRGTLKPTRLQRVDATGNVLEDIALGTPTGRDKRRLCNGIASPSRKLKRSASSVPVMGLASLRLDDDQKPENENEDESEEYIVPNELPRTKRDVTPVPKKRKKMSVTTTISDSDSEQEEMELPVQKEQKEDWGKEQKQLKKKHEQIIQKVVKMRKSPKIDEPLTKAEQTETNTHAATQKEGQEKELELELEVELELEHTLAAKCNISADKLIAQVEAEAAKVAVANEKEDKVEEQTDQDASNITNQKEANADEKANEDSSLVEENVNSFKEKENEECSVLPVEIVPEADLGAEVEVESELGQEMHKAKEAIKEEDHLLDLVDETLLDELVLEESDKEEQEQSHDKHDIDAIMDLGATLEVEVESKSAAAAVTTMLSNEDEEDILEIQASLEDVRQLHTPTSSPGRSGLTLTHPRATVRIDSGDSEASFKSLSAATDTSINQELVVTPPRTSAAAPSPTLPDELISTHNCNINSIDTTSRGVASPIPESYFNIEPERTSEDDDLGRLVEPDFSLSSSRHAISRGTLDDIMTALDS